LMSDEEVRENTEDRVKGSPPTGGAEEGAREAAEGASGEPGSSPGNSLDPTGKRSPRGWLSGVKRPEFQKVTPVTVILVIVFIISAIILLGVTNLRIVRDFFPGQSFFWILRVGLVAMIASLVTYVVIREKRNLAYVAGLLSKLAEANRRLRVLMETGHEIGTMLELRQILEALLEQVMAVTGAEVGSIYLVDEKEDVLKVSFAKGVDEKSMIFTEIPMDKGLLGEAAGGREIVTVDNMHKVDERENVFFGAASPGSQAIVPLVAREKLVGVLISATRGTHDYIDDEKNLLRGIAELASMAITSAGLYKIARRSLDVLAEQRLFNESVIEEMMAGVITSNRAGRIATFNREAQRLTGFSFAEKTQMLLQPEPSPEDNPLGPLEAGMLEVLGAPTGTREGEARIMRKDGTLLTVAYRMCPVLDRDGEVLGAAAIFMEALGGAAGTPTG